MYRPPARGCDIESVEKYKNYLISCFDKLPKNPEVCIIGDINCDMLKKNNLSSRINDLCRAKNITQQVKSPTRTTQTSATLIDLIITNSKLIKSCDVVELGLSDQSLCYHSEGL